MRSPVAALVAVAVGLLEPAAATGEPVSAPAAPRVINVPTAQVQEAGHLYATGGAFVIPDRTPMIGLTLGLADLADVDFEVHDRAAVCLDCPGDEVAESISMASAGFKMGLAEGRFHRWQPALALAMRVPVGDRSIGFAGGTSDLRAARLSLVASKGLGEVELHGGVDAWDADSAGPTGRRTLHDGPARDQLRPLAGLAWNPGIYPRTTLLADWSWAPVFDGDDVSLRWLFGWGVRYQALSWGSIELDVRHREGSGLSDTEVTIRLNGAWDLLDAVR